MKTGKDGCLECTVRELMGRVWKYKGRNYCFNKQHEVCELLGSTRGRVPLDSNYVRVRESKGTGKASMLFTLPHNGDVHRMVSSIRYTANAEHIFDNTSCYSKGYVLQGGDVVVKSVGEEGDVRIAVFVGKSTRVTDYKSDNLQMDEMVDAYRALASKSSVCEAMVVCESQLVFDKTGAGEGRLVLYYKIKHEAKRTTTIDGISDKMKETDKLQSDVFDKRCTVILNPNGVDYQSVLEMLHADRTSIVKYVLDDYQPSEVSSVYFTRTAGKRCEAVKVDVSSHEWVSNVCIHACMTKDLEVADLKDPYYYVVSRYGAVLCASTKSQFFFNLVYNGYQGCTNFTDICIHADISQFDMVTMLGCLDNVLRKSNMEVHGRVISCLADLTNAGCGRISGKDLELFIDKLQSCNSLEDTRALLDTIGYKVFTMKNRAKAV